MIIDFDSTFWGDPFIQELSPIAKLLHIYLWTNSHKNVACLYEITHSTIKHETGLTQKHIDDTLPILYPKVMYDPEKHLVFVSKHIKKSYMRTENISPKIVAAIQKNINAAPKGHPFIKTLLDEYPSLPIEYKENIYTLSKGYPYPSSSGKGSGKDSGKGKDNVEFEKVWKRYPNKDGKSDALRHFNSTVKNEIDVRRISNALENYLNHCALPQNNFKSYKNGSTWFNNWKDWEEWVEPPTPEDREEQTDMVKDLESRLLEYTADFDRIKEWLEDTQPDNPRTQEHKDRGNSCHRAIISIEKKLKQLHGE